MIWKSCAHVQRTWLGLFGCVMRLCLLGSAPYRPRALAWQGARHCVAGRSRRYYLSRHNPAPRSGRHYAAASSSRSAGAGAPSAQTRPRRTRRPFRTNSAPFGWKPVGCFRCMLKPTASFGKTNPTQHPCRSRHGRFAQARAVLPGLAGTVSSAKSTNSSAAPRCAPGSCNSRCGTRVAWAAERHSPRPWALENYA